MLKYWKKWEQPYGLHFRKQLLKERPPVTTYNQRDSRYAGLSML